MRTSWLAGSSFAVLATLAVFSTHGCTLDVSGLQASTSSTSGTPTTSGGGGGGAGPSSASASSSSGHAGGGGTGSSVTTSAATTTGTGCVNTPEVCDDGLDNDCDGHVDCDDTDCSGPTDGRACVPDAPSGWTLVAFAPGDSASCPAGYDESAKVAEAPTSADPACTCDCDCSEANPCEHGTLTAKIGGGCTTLTLTLNVTGGCDPLGQTFKANYGTIKAAPLMVKAIDVPGTGMLPGTQPGATGTTCVPSATVAGGCGGGALCLPKPQAASLCIQHDGDVACPAGPLKNRRLVGAVGAVDDQRTCTGCTCSSDAASCSNPTFAGYTDDTCSSDPAAAAVSAGTCTLLPGQDGWDKDDHFKYVATADNATCAPKGPPSTVMGTVKVQSPTTICCP